MFIQSNYNLKPYRGLFYILSIKWTCQYTFMDSGIIFNNWKMKVNETTWQNNGLYNKSKPIKLFFITSDIWHSTVIYNLFKASKNCYMPVIIIHFDCMTIVVYI